MEDLAERPNAVARQAFAFLEVDSDVEFSPPSPANVSGVSRHPRLAAALNRPSRMRETLKHIVPYSSRQRVRKLINRWNRRPFDKAPILDPAIARALRRRYSHEVLAVEEIIGRDLGTWRSRFLIPIGVAHLLHLLDFLDLLDLLGLSLG